MNLPFLWSYRAFEFSPCLGHLVWDTWYGFFRILLSITEPVFSNPVEMSGTFLRSCPILLFYSPGVEIITQWSVKQMIPLMLWWPRKWPWNQMDKLYKTLVVWALSTFFTVLLAFVTDTSTTYRCFWYWLTTLQACEISGLIGRTFHSSPHSVFLFFGHSERGFFSNGNGAVCLKSRKWKMSGVNGA